MRIEVDSGVTETQLTAVSFGIYLLLMLIQHGERL